MFHIACWIAVEHLEILFLLVYKFIFDVHESLGIFVLAAEAADVEPRLVYKEPSAAFAFCIDWQCYLQKITFFLYAA